MPDDPFTVLGLSPDAAPADVAEAYRTLAQIYHPDRYAQAPERVRLEATRRMQAVNEAYAQVRSRAAPPAPSQPPPRPSGRPAPPPPARPKPPVAVVHYVDGAKGFHNGEVAPLGYQRTGEDMPVAPAAKRCERLDAELIAWFEQQRRNASQVAQQLYATWDEAQQVEYAATVGCSQVPRTTADRLGVPCGLCRP